jgi:hypothetical protein
MGNTYKKNLSARGVAQAVVRLTSKPEALSQTPVPPKKKKKESFNKIPNLDIRMK